MRSHRIDDLQSRLVGRALGAAAGDPIERLPRRGRAIETPYGSDTVVLSPLAEIEKVPDEVEL